MMEDKFFEIAKKESPALRDLINAQEAYIYAVKMWHKDSNDEIWNVREVCRKAIATQALAIAEKDGSNQDLIRILKAEVPGYNWHSIVHNLIYYLPDTVGKYYFEVMDRPEVVDWYEKFGGSIGFQE